MGVINGEGIIELRSFMTDMNVDGIKGLLEGNLLEKCQSYAEGRKSDVVEVEISSIGTLRNTIKND